MAASASEINKNDFSSTFSLPKENQRHPVSCCRGCLYPSVKWVPLVSFGEIDKVTRLMAEKAYQLIQNASPTETEIQWPESSYRRKIEYFQSNDMTITLRSNSKCQQIYSIKKGSIEVIFDRFLYISRISTGPSSLEMFDDGSWRFETKGYSQTDTLLNAPPPLSRFLNHPDFPLRAEIGLAQEEKKQPNSPACPEA